MNEHGDEYGEWLDRPDAWGRAVDENTVGTPADDRAEWEAFAQDMREKPADPPPTDAEIEEMCRRAGYDFIPF